MATLFDQAQRICRGDSLPPPVARLIGFTLTAIAPGQARIAFEAGAQHANPMGTLHGGILCDIADAAMGMAYASTLDEGEGVPAVLEQKTTICCKLLYLLTSKRRVSPPYSRERTHVEGMEENPFYGLNSTLSVGNIRGLLPRYAWTKTIVFLHGLTVCQRCVVLCTLATGTPTT